MGGTLSFSRQKKIDKYAVKQVLPDRLRGVDDAAGGRQLRPVDAPYTPAEDFGGKFARGENMIGRKLSIFFCQVLCNP
ncbi:MAG: hypothetical protein R6V41_02775 [Desulfobacteraceae bacterium]